jgi:hypothetical protein
MDSLLRAHGFVWHCVWLAPNALVLTLGAVLWRRGLHRQFPAFTAFAILSAIGQLTAYAADLSPIVSATNYWRVVCSDLAIEGILKAAIVAEIFAQTLGPYSSVARIGKMSIRGVGALLVFAAVIVAAYAPGDSHVAIISGAHLLEQSIFLIETGLLAFLFLFAAYFRVRMSRPVLGVALGLAISSCVHLGGWAYIANVAPSNDIRLLIDYGKAAVYLGCILLWFYYLLVPHKAVEKSTVPVPQHNLEVWNQELERLLHL